MSTVRAAAVGRLREGFIAAELHVDTFERRLDAVLRAEADWLAQDALWDLPPRRGLLERAGDLLLGRREEVVGLRFEATTIASDAPSRSWVIGRSSSCDAVCLHPSVSRRHARVAVRGGCWTVEDLGSRNGTWVDGTRVERARLVAGAEVSVGELAIELLSA